MTIRIARAMKHYVGLSSDVKPSDATEGSTLHIVDTGEQWVYHDGMWQEDLRMIYALRKV